MPDRRWAGIRPAGLRSTPRKPRSARGTAPSFPLGLTLPPRLQPPAAASAPRRWLASASRAACPPRPPRLLAAARPRPGLAAAPSLSTVTHRQARYPPLLPTRRSSPTPLPLLTQFTLQLRPRLRVGDLSSKSRPLVRRSMSRSPWSWVPDPVRPSRSATPSRPATPSRTPAAPKSEPISDQGFTHRAVSRR